MAWRHNKTALVALAVAFGVTTAWSQSVTVSLPTDTFDASVPIDTVFSEPGTTTNIDPSLGYIGFQADFTFDSAIVNFASPFIVGAGLTASGWTISGHPLPSGPGTIRTFRLSAFVNDGATPLSGSGTLFNLRMVRVSSTPGAFTALAWRPSPDNFIFIDTDLDSFSPEQSDGSITISPPCYLTEGFDAITALTPGGWGMQNNSQPGLGTTGWFQGSTAAFLSQSGAADSYIAANYQNGSGLATLSNWLLTPALILSNGGQLTFWTRTVNSPVHADRLQVRMSTNGASTNVGTTAISVGDFTTLLLDINPTYTLTDYPNVWTQFTMTLSAPGPPTTGRFALRYFVENGGPTGANSDYIGIDTVHYDCNAAPPPTPTPAQTPTPTPINVSGTTSYCTNPVPGPVPNVTVTLTGTASGSAVSDSSGSYQFSLPPGGTYTVTPTKTARMPGSGGIDTTDVIATQRHFTSCAAHPDKCLSGCALTAADVNADGTVNTVDVIAIERFYLGLSTGIANVGKYKFNPAIRTYTGIVTNQTDQNYDTLVFGDVASHFVE